MSLFYKLIVCAVVVAAIFFAGQQYGMRETDKMVLEAQQKTTQACHAEFEEALEKERGFKEEARLRNERLDQTVEKLNERLKKKPAIQIIETPNQEPVYESCDLDSVRLDLGTVRLLNQLRAGN